MNHRVVMNNNGNQMEMQRYPRKDGWLYYKYGEQVVPWECTLTVKNEKGDATGGAVGKKFQLKYNYEKISVHNKGRSIKERDPVRKLEIQNPDKYTGQLAA